jgi:hypothetical protein
MSAVLMHGQRDRVVAWPASIAQPWMLWLAAMLAIAAHGWFTTGIGMGDYLGDSDDATRLIQVRELMASNAWFDLRTMKMGGPPGMLSHWSRLIDLPLATLLSIFGLVLSQSAAELATRIVWPLLILAPMGWALQRTVALVHGETAGRMTLVLFVLCPLGLYQFGLGRVDHHNVLIASTISAALLMWAYPHHRPYWLASGALCGLALAIGYEALAPVAALTIAAAIWGLAEPDMSAPARCYTMGLMAVFTAAFLIEFPPSLWRNIYCDAISLNMVALVAAGGAGLLIALGPGVRWPLAYRLVAILIPGSVGLVTFGVLEPKCLAGPMGQLPPELKSVWLDFVAETRSIVRDLLHGDIEQSLGLTVYFLTGVCLQFRIARTKWRSTEIFLLAIVASFCAFAFWQYKYMGYASVIALVPMAAAVSRLGGWQEVRPEIVRLGAALFLSQSALFAVSSTLSTFVHGNEVERKAIVANADACSKNTPIADLTTLPPGLMAAYIDIGAYIAARTDHRVLSAPYHRIAQAIVANDAIFRSRDDAVTETLLNQWHVDYVVLCRGLDYALVDGADAKGTLRARLAAETPPAFLKPVPLANAHSMFRVWRFAPADAAQTPVNPQP